MPYIGVSLVWGNEDVTKTKDTIKDMGKDIYPNDPPVTVGYISDTRTISVGFNETSDSVNIRIYQNGVLVMDDKDTAEKRTVINYTINGTGKSNCTVFVETNGQLTTVETVDVE